MHVEEGLLGSVSPSDLPWALALVLVAGLVAGAINAVVGSGTLITFPILLILGVPPVVANVSNTIGLVPGAAASVWEYRRTLVASRSLLARILPFTILGAIGGSVLVVALPPGVFAGIVPVLIALALVAVILQPWFQRIARARLAAAGDLETGADGMATSVRWTTIAVLTLLAAYGGYFGAAQGILLLVALSLALGGSYGHVNGIKNVLGGTANLVGSIVFIATAWSQIDWVTVGLISAGSIVGGLVGARWAKRLPPLAYRIVILVVGAAALVVSVLRLFGG
ncbi:MAG TPA: sulfite exporter TauE/SafE family protein [Microbacteriaceae bacterium]|nr:sulfite exporter TauE/SafE family protein [Microbacteriaceae bacterium]